VRWEEGRDSHTGEVVGGGRRVETPIQVRWKVRRVESVIYAQCN
jgi:hypothetical protein